MAVLLRHCCDSLVHVYYWSCRRFYLLASAAQGRRGWRQVRVPGRSRLLKEQICRSKSRKAEGVLEVFVLWPSCCASPRCKAKEAKQNATRWTLCGALPLCGALRPLFGAKHACSDRKILVMGFPGVGKTTIGVQFVEKVSRFSPKQQKKKKSGDLRRNASTQ